MNYHTFTVFAFNMIAFSVSKKYLVSLKSQKNEYGEDYQENKENIGNDSVCVEYPTSYQGVKGTTIVDEKDGELVRRIRSKIFIHDSLWEDVSSAVGGGNPSQEIIKQVEALFGGVNKHLGRLDNGGFMLDFDHNVTKLRESGLILRNSYVDRLNGNVTKAFNEKDFLAHTFTFQEAIQELPDRHAVDLRILFLPLRIIERQKGKIQKQTAAAEKNCMCNPNGFSCILVYAIEFPEVWSFFLILLAHEIGHTLGMDLHDDEFPTTISANKLVMWSSTRMKASVWSPEAKKRINKHDNSCLSLCRRPSI